MCSAARSATPMASGGPCVVFLGRGRFRQECVTAARLDRFQVPGPRRPPAGHCLGQSRAPSDGHSPACGPLSVRPQRRHSAWPREPHAHVQEWRVHVGAAGRSECSEKPAFTLASIVHHKGSSGLPRRQSGHVLEEHWVVWPALQELCVSKTASSELWPVPPPPRMTSWHPRPVAPRPAAGVTAWLGAAWHEVQGMGWGLPPWGVRPLSGG